MAIRRRRRRPLFSRRKRRFGRYGRTRRFRTRRRFRRSRRFRGSKPEWKFASLAYGPLNVTQTFNLRNITSTIAQGVGRNARVGTKIRVRKLVFYTYADGTALMPECDRIRMCITRITGRETDLPAAVTDQFDTMPTGGAPLITNNAFLIRTGIPKKGQHWRLVSNKATGWISMSNNGSIVNVAGVGVCNGIWPAHMAKAWKTTIRYRRGLPVTYDDGSNPPGFNRCNQLYLSLYGFSLANAIAIQGPTVYTYGRVYYTDE